MKKRRKGESASAADDLTATDVGRVVGLALVLVSFLLLASIPQAVFRYCKRYGYRPAQVELLSPAGRSRSLRVRLLATGEELSVRRNVFDAVAEHAVVPVWHNPQARLVLGLTVFDERLVSPARHAQPASGTEALGGLVALLATGLAGAWLVRRRG